MAKDKKKSKKRERLEQTLDLQPPVSDMSSEELKAAEIHALRLLTRGAYALQKLRIQMGLRLCANFRNKLKVSIDDVINDEEDDADELSEKAQSIIDMLKLEYGRLTDGIAKNRTLPRREGFVGTGVISTFTELALIDDYLYLESREKKQFRHIGDALQDFAIYRDWLRHQIGIGPAMAAVLITKFDVHKAVRPSQFWAIAGLDVGPDGKARCRRKEHLIEREYVAKDGKTKKKLSTTFDTWLQSRLLGALGTSLMRTGSPYKRFYDGYKKRKQDDPNIRHGTLKDKKADIDAGLDGDDIWHPLRIHRAASRYMVKTFVADFWRRWREIEGLPVVPTYHEAKQGGHSGRAA